MRQLSFFQALMILACVSVLLLLGACSTTTTVPVASPGTDECATLLQEQWTRLDTISYQEFNMSQEVGWRALGKRKCWSAGADLLDEYGRRHPTHAQMSTIRFHAGQMRAYADERAAAIAALQGALAPARTIATTEFNWNAYVRATIAFLEQDLAALQQYRDDLAASTHLNNRQNLRFVNGLVRYFDRPYREAYRPVDD